MYLFEKSNINQMIGEHIRTVEFVLRRKENPILFIEAKSSSLQERTSKERYDKFIAEIVEKYLISETV